MRTRRAILIALLAAVPLGAQGPAAPYQVRAYKTIGRDSLVVHVFSPKAPGSDRAAIVLFHGGGFVWGGPEITHGSAQAFAAQGLVAFSVQYRLADRRTVTPLEQLQDTYDAMRWVRAHAAEYGVDPKRVAAQGVSAGGLLIGTAAGQSDPAVRPNALVMVSPGVGSVQQEDPYLTGLLLGRARASEILPMSHIIPGMPPTVIISGELDSVTFDAISRQYCDRLTRGGARCDFHSYPKLGHVLSRKLDAASQLNGDFDWDEQATEDAEAKIMAFLRSIGFIR